MITLKRSRFIVLMALAAIPAVHAETLDEVVRHTLSTNPDVLEKINTRISVDKEVRQAKAGYYPTIDLNAGIGRERSDNSFTRAGGYDWRSLTRQELSATLRQPLYAGGATTHEVGRQTERANSRAYTMFATAEQIALRTTEVYLEVLRRQELVKLAQENLKSHEKTYEQVGSRSVAGVGRGADVDQARSRLLLAKSNLMAEESNLREAEINYYRVVNAAPNSLITPSAPFDQVTETLQAAVKLAVDNHPTLKAAAADIEAAKEQHSTAKAPYLPKLDLELEAARNEDLAGIAGENNVLSAMVRMRYNLYAGGRDKARRAQTFYQIDEAKEIRNHTCRQVVESMRLSWNAYKTTDAQAIYLRQRLESSLSARDNYRSQFNLGQRSLLDLLDSENEVFGASKEFTNGEFDRLFSSYRVMAGEGKLLGTLLIELPPEAQPLTDNLTAVDCTPEFPAQQVPYATPLGPAPRMAVTPAPTPITQIVVERVVEVPSEPIIIEKNLPPVILERVTLQAGAIFDSNKSEIKPAGQAELNELAVKLSKIKNIGGLEIIGHTDSQGSDAYNRELALRRATAVAEYLISQGISRDLLTVSGMGEDIPVATNKTAEGRSKNRRVEVNIKVTRQVEPEVK